MTININVTEFGIVGNHFVAKSDDITNKGWFYAPIPDDLSEPLWRFIDTPDSQAVMDVSGVMALQVDSAGAKVWVDALLVNSSDTIAIDSFAVYIDPADGEARVKTWSEHYPSGTPTVNSMPRANICAMWKDYLILGDIVWNEDDTEPLAENNSARYKHGLWFSQPGKTDSWDPVDTVFVGQKSGGNNVVGIFPIERGLLVFTTTMIILLDGTPDDFVYRELRARISPESRDAVTFWPSQGGVSWIDGSDRVWYTNGEEFVRFDSKINIEGGRSVTAIDNYLIVAAQKEIHVLRLFDESFGWTRLNLPFSWRKINSTATKIFGLEVGIGGGTFILDDNVFGILDMNFLWDRPGQMTVMDLYADERGKFNGKNVVSTVRTRPLPGAGHNTTFWHRFGLRAVGSGSLNSVAAYPSTNLDEDSYVVNVGGDLEDRKDYVFPAHGPSLEAVFEAEFEGDVTVENMTVWVHKGRPKR